MDGIDAAAGPVLAIGSTPPAGGMLSNVFDAVGIVLVVLLVASRILWLYNECTAVDEEATPSSSSSARAPSPIFRPRRAVPLSLLPVFVNVMSSSSEEKVECAVCLEEFGELEAGRLLPQCRHGFHEECITTWLQQKTTCPLCRAPVATK